MTEGEEITSIDVSNIRTGKGWSRAQMAKFLGCNESTVWRMENGGNISGPVRRLLLNLKFGIESDQTIATTCTQDGTWIAHDKRTGLAHSGKSALAAEMQLRRLLGERLAV